jgi:hypothetical protein
MLLGLRRMFLTLGVFVLAVRISGSSMRFRCGFVMLGGPVVRVFHGGFLTVGRRMSASADMVTHRGIHNRAIAVEQRKGDRAFISSHFRRSKFETTYR